MNERHRQLISYKLGEYFVVVVRVLVLFIVI